MTCFAANAEDTLVNEVLNSNDNSPVRDIRGRAIWNDSAARFLEFRNNFVGRSRRPAKRAEELELGHAQVRVEFFQQGRVGGALTGLDDLARLERDALVSAFPKSGRCPATFLPVIFTTRLQIVLEFATLQGFVFPNSPVVPLKEIANGIGRQDAGSQGLENAVRGQGIKR